MTLHTGTLCQIEWYKMLLLCKTVAIGIKVSLSAQYDDWCKIFPLRILCQSVWLACGRSALEWSCVCCHGGMCVPFDVRC